MRRSKRLQAAKCTAVKDDGDSSDLWCLCQEPEDSCFMIQCDIQGSNCKIWYHGDCVGVSKSQGKRMEHYGEDFICPPCSNEISKKAGVVDCTAPSPVVSMLSCLLPPSVGMMPLRGLSSVRGFPLLMMRLSTGDVTYSWFLMVVLVGILSMNWQKNFLSYGEAGAFEAIAIKAAMLMCALLLQKPHSRMSGRDLASCLQRCLSLWNQGDIDALLIEGRTIQHRLLSHSGSSQKFDDDHHISRHFVECMLRGNVRSALNSITCEQSGVPLRLDSPVSPDNPSWLVLDELKKKHPVGKLASSAVLLPPPCS